MESPCIYILTNKPDGVLYIGVSNGLIQRIYQHKSGQGSQFTKKYNLNKLVYFEQFESMIEAIQREKQLKKWNREWKVELIETNNPEWEDLWDAVLGG